MVFNSFQFLGFFALTGILFDIIKQKWRWVLLLMVSVIFIAYSTPKGLLFLVASCGITYFCTLGIDRLYQSSNGEKNKKRNIQLWAKLLIVIDIVANLGIVFATKYINFFGNIIASCSGRTFNAISVIVPLGISFYTFMILGYAIDVYREEYRPQRNFAKLFLFASYFPQLIDGPISRYNDVQEKLYNPPDIEYKRCRDGLMLFGQGLFNKLCVADNIYIYVDMIYGNYQDYHGLVVFSAAVAYAIYIYADFSGCIDMARGVSRYFGIELKENFNHPYFAESVEDFWRRWHMTLSSWFKDYLFYPILRSRKVSQMGKKLRMGGYKQLAKIIPTSIALLAVWIFTGLWHGARGTYVLWGLYYGIIIIITNAINILNKRKGIRRKIPSIIITFIIVCFGYILFNSENTDSAIGMIGNMFSLPIVDIGVVWNLGIKYYKLVGAAVYFAVSVISIAVFIISDFLLYKGKNIYQMFLSGNRIVKYVSMAIFVFFLLLMMNRTSGDFTYMQF